MINILYKNLKESTSYTLSLKIEQTDSFFQTLRIFLKKKEPKLTSCPGLF